MTKKHRHLKQYERFEREKVARSVSKFRGGAVQLARFERFKLAQMKRAYAESNALAERMARDAD